jgi:hypothetical protein
MWEDVRNILGFNVRFTDEEDAIKGEFNLGDPDYEQAYFYHKGKALAEGKGYHEAREHAHHEAEVGTDNADC